MRQGEKANEKRYSLMELAATLDDVISLGRGDPDLDTPRHVIDRAFELLNDAPEKLETMGLAELRSAIARRYRDEKGLDFDPDSEILVTNGAQEALFLAVMAILNPGDKVLVPDPRYSSYDQAIETSGGDIVSLPTGADFDFALDPATLAGAEEAKLLILINPSNPTGALIEEHQVEDLARIARDAGLLVISDEVYEKLVFDGQEVRSVAACEGMRERTVTLSSFSKSYAMTGFRVGYLLGDPAFIEAVTRIKAAVSGPTPLFSQLAARAALQGPQDFIDELGRIFTGRRKVMLEGLDRLRIPYGRHGGGFFIWADVSRFDLDAETFCHRLLTEARVLMFPGTAFGQKWSNFVRISMLQPEETIAKALARIENFVEQL